MITSTNRAADKPPCTGFTLIELMMVLVIIGVLLSIALPSYKQSLFKARRTEAKTMLLDIATRQEQLMLDSSTYTTELSDLGLTSLNESEEKDQYFATLQSCPTGTIKTCYVLTATPSEGSQQINDSDCTSFSVDSFGNKTATGDTKNECW